MHGEPKLAVTFDVRELGAQPVGKTMFFSRNIPPSEKVSAEIWRDVTAGQVGADVIKSFSVMLSSIYAPLLTAEDGWGLISQEERRAFSSLLSRFSMSLTDVVETIDFRTSMKLQDPALPDIAAEAASLPSDGAPPPPAYYQTPLNQPIGGVYPTVHSYFLPHVQGHGIFRLMLLLWQSVQSVACVPLTLPRTSRPWKPHRCLV